MGQRTVQRRRRSQRLVAALVAVGLTAVLAPVSAGAQATSVVANPGTLTLTVTGGAVQFGGLRLPLPGCDPGSAPCLSMTANLASDGSFRVPATSLRLPAIENALADLGVDLPVGLRLEVYSSGGVGGVLLPDGGLTRLEFPVGVRVVPDLSALPGGNLLGLFGASSLSCGVGPVSLSLTTDASGGLQGSPYDPATGALSLVDGAYSVPRVSCSPLLISLVQGLLGGTGPTFGALDLSVLLGGVDPSALLGGVGELLAGLGLDGFVDLDALDLAGLDVGAALAALNAAVGLPAAPGVSGTTLEVLITRPDGQVAVLGGGERWPVMTFGDVPRGGEVERAVRWLAARGITTGVGGSAANFAPRASVTRGQMAAFLWRLMDRPVAPASCGFTDVAATAFYATAVCWLAANGITTGTNAEGTTFSPNAPVTRSQMARFLWRLAGEPSASAVARFADVGASSGFAPAVNWLRAHGITQGIGGSNVFAPRQEVTRAQMAMFLHRLVERVSAWEPGATVPLAMQSR